MTHRQQLLWIPGREHVQGGAPAARGEAPFEGERPTLLWTLSHFTTETQPPTLPYTPIHMRTAFLEDHIHDWRIDRGRIVYYSRVHDLYTSGVWLLLEWK